MFRYGLRSVFRSSSASSGLKARTCPVLSTTPLNPDLHSFASDGIFPRLGYFYMSSIVVVFGKTLGVVIDVVAFRQRA